MSVFIIQWQLSSNNISFCFFSSVAPSSSSFSSIYCSSSVTSSLLFQTFCFLIIFVCLLSRLFSQFLFQIFFVCFFLTSFSQVFYFGIFFTQPFSHRQFFLRFIRFLRFLLYSFSRLLIKKAFYHFFQTFLQIRKKKTFYQFFSRDFSLELLIYFKILAIQFLKTKKKLYQIFFNRLFPIRFFILARQFLKTFSERHFTRFFHQTFLQNSFKLHSFYNEFTAKFFCL